MSWRPEPSLCDLVPQSICYRWTNLFFSIDRVAMHSPFNVGLVFKEGDLLVFPTCVLFESNQDSNILYFTSADRYEYTVC